MQDFDKQNTGEKKLATTDVLIILKNNISGAFRKKESTAMDFLNIRGM
jgi:hypothetical protein